MSSFWSLKIEICENLDSGLDFVLIKFYVMCVFEKVM